MNCVECSLEREAAHALPDMISFPETWEKFVDDYKFVCPICGEDCERGSADYMPVRGEFRATHLKTYCKSCELIFEVSGNFCVDKWLSKFGKGNKPNCGAKMEVDGE